MLKHLVITLFLFGAINTVTVAQNLHSTKAAKIRFFSSLAAEDIEAVSYTHLTLPTKRIV